MARQKQPVFPNLFNVAVSLALVLIFAFVYLNRYTLGEYVFDFVIFGFLIAGGIYFWKNILNRDEIKHDERTEHLAGKSARVTLLIAFGFMVLLLAFLQFSNRPTSDNGVLAILAGLLILVYSSTYALLESR